MNDDAFPHQGFPSGWYQVAWAGELEVGAVQPLRYFSRDLVLYRGADGEHHLLDAFCPHMGAHLGYGGCVEGDNIVCPYHGWTWAPDGHNVIVPSEGKPTDRRRIGTWTTAVANGIVWTWFDAAGAPTMVAGPERPARGGRGRFGTTSIRTAAASGATCECVRSTWRRTTSTSTICTGSTAPRARSTCCPSARTTIASGRAAGSSTATEDRRPD